MTDVLRPTAVEALAAWGERVRKNNVQAEAFREGAPPSDFYAPMASAFRADPHRTGEEALDVLRSLVVPGETWLDIGAGGGRYALPLAVAGANVVAIEPSAGMLGVLRAGMEEHGLTNIQVVESRWPMDSAPRGDVSLIAHVSYDIAEIGPFLDAMEASASRLCVAMLLSESPAAVAATAWPEVHGVERDLLPALPEFVALLFARGRVPEVRLAGARPPATYDDIDMAHRFFLAQTFIAPGGEKDRKLRAWLEARRNPDGQVAITSTPQPIGVVTWAPGG